MVGQTVVNLDPGGFRDPEQRVFVEIGLHDAPTFEIELLVGRAEPVQDGSLHLVICAAQIDDLGSDVSRDDDSVDLKHASWRDGDLRDIGEVAPVTEMEGDAPAAATRQRPAPAGFFRGQRDDAAHPGCVIAVAAFTRRGDHPAVAQQRKAPNWDAAREQILLRPALPAGAYGYQPYDLQRYYQTGPRWR